VTSTGTIQINKYEYMYEEHSDEYMDDTIKQYEYMYEEHSDEYMDDTIYEYMYEEHSDEYMDDTIYEEHSDDIIKRPNQDQQKISGCSFKGHSFLQQMVFLWNIFHAKRPSFRAYIYCQEVPFTSIFLIKTAHI
jgi:hypothetical protein